MSESELQPGPNTFIRPGVLEALVVSIFASLVVGFLLVPKQYRLENYCPPDFTGPCEKKLPSLPISFRDAQLVAVNDPAMQWTYRLGLCAILVIASVSAVLALRIGIKAEKDQNEVDRLQQ